jgi:hypothetical protein
MESHQTIRLISGRHTSPASGACVMELASMLAGEPFSDRPECVCPVIAEFLRTYNDHISRKLRQDLFDYAARAVGSNQGHRIERRRANRLLDWWLEGAPPRRRRARRVFWQLMPRTATRDIELAYRAARWAAASPERHARVLALMDELVGPGVTLDPLPQGILRRDAPVNA